MRTTTLILGLVGLLGLAACGSDDTAVAAGAGTRVDLAQVAEQCVSPGGGQPGIAVVSTELRDANTTVDLPGCIIHLEAGADVHLNNVTITGGLLNIHDRDTDPSSNNVRLQKVTVDSAGLLIELNDADDTFQAEASDLTTTGGIHIRVADPDANAGGDIRLVASKLLATDTDAPVVVAASEHSGVIRLVNTSVDTRGPLTILAADCEARLAGEKLDCSTEALVADIE
ncbi:hypothetical protein BH20ACT2_BH20ACT2_19110 [soil metagenome]